MPIGIKGFQKNHPVPENIRDKISKSMQGGNSTSFKKGHKTNLGKRFPKKKYPNAGMRNREHTEKTKEKIRKGNLGKHSGENNPFWKGGITPLRRRIYVSSEYKKWRKLVFERDNYTCQWCGQKGSYLEAHHLTAFNIVLQENSIDTIDQAMNCQALWDVDNGLTLCKKCHLRLDTIRARFVKPDSSDEAWQMLLPIL